jgi:hypothetical protein
MSLLVDRNLRPVAPYSAVRVNLHNRHALTGHHCEAPCAATRSRPLLFRRGYSRIRRPYKYSRRFAGA